MAVKPPPILPSRTALWGLGFRFEMIALQAQGVYYDIRDIWLLGKWLSYPLWVFAWSMFVARDKCWEADSALVAVEGWINHLTDGWGIIDIIETLSYNLRLVIRDPIEFIRQNIRSLSFEFRMILDNVDVWFRAKFNINYPDLFQIVRNPFDWLRYKLYDLFPGLVTFFISPWNTVMGWVRYTFPFMTDLLNNPSGTAQSWLQQRYPWLTWFFFDPANFIINRIRDYSGELGAFITDPLHWFRELLARLLHIQEQELNDLPKALFRVVVRVILDSLGNFQDEVQTAICDIVLKFI